MMKLIVWLKTSRLGQLFLRLAWSKIKPVLLKHWHNFLAARYKKKRDKAQAEAKPKFDEVMNNPESTPDQKGKAYEDYHNSGR